MGASDYLYTKPIRDEVRQSRRIFPGGISVKEIVEAAYSRQRLFFLALGPPEEKIKGGAAITPGGNS